MPEEADAALRAILFDFDFTLADSSRGAHACINHALAELKLPPQSNWNTDRTIGLSLPKTLAALTGIDRNTR